MSTAKAWVDIIVLQRVDSCEDYNTIHMCIDGYGESTITGTQYKQRMDVGGT